MFGLGNSQSNSFDRSVAKSVPLVKDPEGIAATNLNDVEAKGGVELRKKATAVTVSLRKRDMSGIRAQVMVILDHSGSMSSDYRNGKVQDLVDRFLAFGLTVDIDGTIPVVPFDSSVKRTVDVSMNNFKGVVDREIFDYYSMGSTNLTSALEVVRNEAKKTDTPLFVAVITDGEPNDKHSAREIVKDLSRYPVFLKFLAVQNVRFLEELDDMTDAERLLDNVDSKSYTGSMSSVSDEQFADDMTDEWNTWVAAALSAGVLTQ